ncbi:MAG TPA: ATP-grasp domain-containing protein [Actinospica sp.]|nr:ATP-grasp domain-containing protein [Actinospica sp.]
MSAVPENRSGAFVQIGATRDGLDPYLDCARRRGMPAVLVETDAYLRWRRALGRRQFDLELPVARPHDPDSVRAALAVAGVGTALLLTGFERYAAAGFELARRMRVAPWPRVGAEFAPPDKALARAALAAAAPELPQPRLVPLTADAAPAAHLGYPQVLKPVDGGGGLGVLLAEDAYTARRAVEQISALRNYGGGAFAGLLAEEYVAGPEVSIQALAVDGEPRLLSVCEKITALEPVPGEPGLSGFRELGHVVRPGADAGEALRRLAARCLEATGYREGPFHLDAILGEAGPVFVEAGFRLSGGGLAGLVRRATGFDWAEEAFRVHLGEAPADPPSAPPRAVGQVAALHAAELEDAEAIEDPSVTIEVLRAARPELGGLSPADLDLLASDRLRHTAVLGRIIASGPDADHVHRLLADLVAVRTGV